jgi:hypothetical protein
MAVKPYCYPGAHRLAAAALLAGFTRSELSTIVGISGQETSGNVWAVGGPNPNGSYDYGAWQINMKAHQPKHPEWFNGMGLNWCSYVDNARMARVIYLEAGSSFRPWYGYTTGRYNTRTGPYAHSNGYSWKDWAEAGIKIMDNALSGGKSLEVVASIYFP